jgi:hypothetical protein
MWSWSLKVAIKGAQRHPSWIISTFQVVSIPPSYSKLRWVWGVYSPLCTRRLRLRNRFDLIWSMRLSATKNSRCWLFLPPRLLAINPFMTTFSLTWRGYHAWKRIPIFWQNPPEAMFSFEVKPREKYVNDKFGDKLPSECLILEMQYNGTYILGRPAYAGYLRSFNEGTRVGIANSNGLTRRSLTAW